MRFRYVFDDEAHCVKMRDDQGKWIESRAYPSAEEAMEVAMKLDAENASGFPPDPEEKPKVEELPEEPVKPKPKAKRVVKAKAARATPKNKRKK